MAWYARIQLWIELHYPVAGWPVWDCTMFHPALLYTWSWRGIVCQGGYSCWTNNQVSFRHVRVVQYISNFVWLFLQHLLLNFFKKGVLYDIIILLIWFLDYWFLSQKRIMLKAKQWSRKNLSMSLNSILYLSNFATNLLTMLFCNWNNVMLQNLIFICRLNISMYLFILVFTMVPTSPMEPNVTTQTVIIKFSWTGKSKCFLCTL